MSITKERPNPTRPWENETPEGTGGGQHINRDNYLRPPDPKREMVDKVEEIEPWHSIYPVFSDNLYEDILTPPKGSPEGVYYDHVAAQRAVDFIQNLYHFEGKWAGHKFRLMWWQERLIRYVFGWMNADGLRLIRRVYLEIPRKNGKSMFAAAIALYLAYGDGEAAPQVFFAAADKEQAGDTYNKGRAMVQADQWLADNSVIYGPAKKILIPQTHGELRTLSSKTIKLYGLNLHGLVFDELMVQRNREMWDALTTAQGAREQPLIVAITTAGWSKQSLAYEQREYTVAISKGDFTDPTFFGCLYTVDEDAEWWLEETWKKAAPSLGETVTVDYYREKCQEAEKQPSAQNSFRTLMLCQWVGQQKRLVVMADWDSEEVPDLPDLKGKMAFGGLDLSATTDLTAFALDFPNEPSQGYHSQLVHFWLPGEDIRERSRRDRVDYQVWADQGLITLIPGPVIRTEYVHQGIRDWADLYNITDISFDRWGAAELSRHLEEDGFKMVKMGQGYASMSAPTKEFLRLVADHHLVTGGNPILRWMADNVAGLQDPAGNVKFDKQESGSRIDGLVAGVMALDGSIRRGKGRKSSIYDSLGPDDIWDDGKWTDLDKDGKKDDWVQPRH